MLSGVGGGGDIWQRLMIVVFSNLMAERPLCTVYKL